MKKYLTRNINGDYFVVDHPSGFDIDQLILIPEGAEIAILGNNDGKVYFWKDKGDSIFISNEWCDSIQYMTSDMFKQIWKDHKVVWQEMSNEITEDNVQIDFNKLKVDLTKVPTHPLLIKVYGDEDKITKTYELLKKLGYSACNKESINCWIQLKAYYLNINFVVGGVKEIGFDFKSAPVVGDAIEYEDLLKLVTLVDVNKLKVEWFEKFLNGVKVQYRIGIAVGSETSQWCNMTYNSLKNLQHSPIEFREAPKYVVLNGITFKDKESLLRHIANNYNLD